MSHRCGFSLPTFLTLLVVGGCTPHDEDVAQEVSKPRLDLSTGKIEPRLLGRWVSKAEGQSYDLRKDGGFEIATDRMIASGRSATRRLQNTSTGEWTATANRLLMRASDGLEYDIAWTVSTDRKVLSIKGNRATKPTEFRREL